MFTLDNTEGYTQAQCDALNAEFDARLRASGVDPDSDLARDMEKSFSDEVAGR